MDILKAEIARKKQQMAQSDVLVPGKKFFKRSDLAAKQEEEYWKKCKRFKSAANDKDGESSINEGSQSGDDNNRSAEDAHIQLPRKEVVRRLRDRNEPILLFGETEYEAYQRLKKLEFEMPEVVNKGFKNDFKAAMDKVDEDYLNEILNTAQPTAESTTGADVTIKESNLTIEQILDKARGMGKGDLGWDSEVVLNFLKLLLQMWGDRLNARTQQEKLSFRGKMASATHRQTVDYIKPLFRKLKKKELSPDILGCMVDIVQCMMDRDYLRANDAYLQMAIGNAPWPIGVTMVGIHARTGREKIFDRNVAHVLNDETQRKYIQAVKRLMTQCQKLFPTDPSRSVDYHSE